MRLIVPGIIWIGMCCLAGCANDTAVAHGQNTALNGVDLVAMTDDMARKIMASPAVQAALAKEGKLRVVVEPVENNMTAEILPSGPAQAFTGRLRVLLSQHNPNDFIWIMNRDAWEYLRQSELAIDPGPPPDAIQPQYALTARFSSLTKESAERRSSYYLCQYELTDLDHRYVLWTDKYEVKKTAVKQFLD
jgi:Peptidoglycan-synthase activator LpoB